MHSSLATNSSFLLPSTAKYKICRHLLYPLFHCCVVFFNSLPFLPHNLTEIALLKIISMLLNPMVNAWLSTYFDLSAIFDIKKKKITPSFETLFTWHPNHYSLLVLLTHWLLLPSLKCWLLFSKNIQGPLVCPSNTCLPTLPH